MLIPFFLKFFCLPRVHTTVGIRRRETAIRVICSKDFISQNVTYLEMSESLLGCPHIVVLVSDAHAYSLGHKSYTSLAQVLAFSNL